MKKKNKINMYWEGFPEELRFMCLAEVRGTGHYCTKPALNYLIDHVHECDTFVYETTAFDVINWIDTVFEMCLFPLEQHEDDWEENLTLIRMLVDKYEKLLHRVAPSNYKKGYKIPFNDRFKPSMIEYAQKLEVYYSVLYMFTEEWEKLQEHLTSLLMFTERNAEHMLNYEKAEEYASCDDWAEYHYFGTDAWEPLNWLTREFIPGGNASKLFVQTYEKYVLFLNELNKRLPSVTIAGDKSDDSSQRSKACDHLCANAEKRLRSVCDWVLNEIYDELEYSDGNKEDLVCDKERYETMYRNSVERCDKGDVNE